MKDEMDYAAFTGDRDAWSIFLDALEQSGPLDRSRFLPGAHPMEALDELEKRVPVLAFRPELVPDSFQKKFMKFAKKEKTFATNFELGPNRWDLRRLYVQRPDFGDHCDAWDFATSRVAVNFLEIHRGALRSLDGTAIAAETGAALEVRFETKDVPLEERTFERIPVHTVMIDRSSIRMYSHRDFNPTGRLEIFRTEGERFREACRFTRSFVDPVVRAALEFFDVLGVGCPATTAYVMDPIEKLFE